MVVLYRSGVVYKQETAEGMSDVEWSSDVKEEEQEEEEEEEDDDDEEEESESVE